MGRPERELDVLNAIDAGQISNQRVLADQLGIALGLANLYLRRLARKGYIKVAEFPRKPRTRKRLRYLLTPRGIAEKSRLTYTYISRPLALYRYVRVTLRDALAGLKTEGHSRVALYGTGEAAELAYLTLRELGLEPIGVFDWIPSGTFLGMPVQDVRDLVGQATDAVILATFDDPTVRVPPLVALGIPADRIVTLVPAQASNGSR